MSNLWDNCSEFILVALGPSQLRPGPLYPPCLLLSRISQKFWAAIGFFRLWSICRSWRRPRHTLVNCRPREMQWLVLDYTAGSQKSHIFIWDLWKGFVPRLRIASFPVHVEGRLVCDELDDGGGPAEELGRRRAVAPQWPDERGLQLVVLPAVDEGVDGGLAEVQQDHKLMKFLEAIFWFHVQGGPSCW